MMTLFFCKTTLHHSEKFQGIPSIYLINLTIMKHCQDFAVLAVLDLSLLRYFPSRNLVDRADNCYTSLYFLFLLFFFVYSIQNFKICCYLFLLFFPVFFSALYPFHPILFYSSFYPLFCFLPLFIRFIFLSPLLFSFQICYLFFSLFLLLCSVCFSLMLYYYSVCSLSISLHLFRSLYLILLCYLFCSCFCFLYTSSFW